MNEGNCYVKNWLNSEANFEEGVALYFRFGRNRNLASLFPGRKQRYESKLRYELCKSVGLDWRETVIRPVGGVTLVEDAVVVQKESGIVDTVGSDLDEQMYPPVVRRVIHEYGEAYRERSRLHYQMSTGPGDNTSESMAVRRDLLARIKALSLRMDELFSAKDNYLRSKVLPDAAALWPPEKDAVSSASLSSTSTSTSSSISSLEDQPLPDDPLELRRLKKNLQTYNVKDNNLLLYQSATVQQDKHPMPAGPRRLGIEKRIRARLKQIERIDYKLVEHAG